MLEIMLSLAFISLITAMPFLWDNFSLPRTNLTHASELTVEALRTAEQFAVAQKAGGAWGVQVRADGLTLFQGDSFAGRNSAQDRTLTFAQDVAITGVDEVVFAQATGIPNTTGVMLLSLNGNNSSITIREHGFVDY